MGREESWLRAAFEKLRGGPLELDLRPYRRLVAEVNLLAHPLEEATDDAPRALSWAASPSTTSSAPTVGSAP